MLDVHAPEHGISNMREFFLHLFTITCGLLIALGLENAAEAWHHRQERNEAQESIRQELTDNRAGARAGAGAVLKQAKAMSALLTFLEARSEGKPSVAPASDVLAFGENEIPDAAWRVASTTGVLAYMDNGELQRDASAYREQDLLQKQEQKALEDVLLLGSVLHKNEDLGALTPERAKDALPYARRGLADLNGILAVGQGMLTAYDAALQ